MRFSRRVPVALFGLLGLLLIGSLTANSARADEPQGYYVLQNTETKAKVSATLLSDPDLAGIVLRRRWREVNPAPGSYDWSYFDREIARAKSYGKKVQLIVFSGYSAPEWLYQAGARRLRFQDSRFGTQWLSMPVPWDPIMLEHWHAFVRAMGARYDGDPTVTLVHMAGPTRFSCELRMPNEVKNEPDWSPAILIDAWQQTIRCYNAAFPNTAASLNLCQATTNTDGVAPAVAEYAVVELGSRATLQHNSLSARTSMDYQIHAMIVAYASAGVRVGFEMVSASSESRFGGPFSTAVQTGRNAGAQFLNLYSPDVSRLVGPY